MLAGCRGELCCSCRHCTGATAVVLALSSCMLFWRQSAAADTSITIYVVYILSRSHLARRLLAHITLQTQGVARTRLRLSSRSSGSKNNRAGVEGIKVLHAYGGRKSVLYTLLNSATDTGTSAGSPSAVSRHNRDERLKQLVAFAGKSNRLLVKPCVLCRRL